MIILNTQCAEIILMTQSDEPNDFAMELDYLNRSIVDLYEYLACPGLVRFNDHCEVSPQYCNAIITNGMFSSLAYIARGSVTAGGENLFNNNDVLFDKLEVLLHKYDTGFCVKRIV